MKNQNINAARKYIESFDSNNDWRIINAKGVFYQSIGEYTKASSEYMNAKALSKNSKLVLSNLASLLYIE